MSLKCCSVHKMETNEKRTKEKKEKKCCRLEVIFSILLFPLSNVIFFKMNI